MNVRVESLKRPGKVKETEAIRGCRTVKIVWGRRWEPVSKGRQ